VVQNIDRFGKCLTVGISRKSCMDRTFQLQSAARFVVGRASGVAWCQFVVYIHVVDLPCASERDSRHAALMTGDFILRHQV
jgi:hypothetical protein